MKILCKSRERSHRFRIAIGRYGHKDFRRSNIDAGGIGPHHRQIPVQLSILPFLCFCHGSPPSMFGNEPGVQNGEPFKRDHRTQKAWRVTHDMAHGPGIKLMNGLAEASTNGNTIYAYRCRGEVLNYLPVWTGPRQNASSFLLWTLATTGSTNEE